MSAVINLAYLLAASLFIVGLKRMSSPATARLGNQLAAVGMLIAIVATLLKGQIISPALMIAGLVIGVAIGAFLARWVKMTAMPEMVAAFNGFGGGASALVAAAEIGTMIEPHTMLVSAQFLPAPVSALTAGTAITVALSMLIGTVTFSGSFIAFGKLAEFITGRPASFPGMRIITVLLVVGVVVATGFAVVGAADFAANPAPVLIALGVLAVLALILGVFLVIPIGGADMPVVVALLNSYSGMAAAATGFVLQNYALIISGALVGAAGLILTKIMCDAMNRSLLNVLMGGFGGGDDAEIEGATSTATGGSIKEISSEDCAILLSYASKVVVVPGYGMAVAQAQHAVRELADMLQTRGVTVKYAIHPVAGRMPGHMNVLLAEANVPYDQLFDMDDINPDFDSTDVVLVIGANDVVNPAARSNPASPIYGMPILNVDRATNIIVLKRSMRPGYAGVENELFYDPKTSMLFGDAKATITKLITEVKIA